MVYGTGTSYMGQLFQTGFIVARSMQVSLVVTKKMVVYLCNDDDLINLG